MEIKVYFANQEKDQENRIEKVDLIKEMTIKEVDKYENFIGVIVEFKIEGYENRIFVPKRAFCK